MGIQPALQGQVQRLRLALQLAAHGQAQLVRSAHAVCVQGEVVQALASGLQAAPLQHQAEGAVLGGAAAPVCRQAGQLDTARQYQTAGLHLGADIRARRGAG